MTRQEFLGRCQTSDPRGTLQQMPKDEPKLVVDRGEPLEKHDIPNPDEHAQTDHER